MRARMAHPPQCSTTWEIQVAKKVLFSSCLMGKGIGLKAGLTHPVPLGEAADSKQQASEPQNNTH